MSSVKKVKWESQIAGGRLRATQSVRVWMIIFFFLGKKSLVGKKIIFHWSSELTRCLRIIKKDWNQKCVSSVDGLSDSDSGRIKFLGEKKKIRYVLFIKRRYLTENFRTSRLLTVFRSLFTIARPIPKRTPGKDFGADANPSADPFNGSLLHPSKSLSPSLFGEMQWPFFIQPASLFQSE